jgi:hypothetical protein
MTALASHPADAGARLATSWFPVRVASAVAGVGVVVRELR